MFQSIDCVAQSINSQIGCQSIDCAVHTDYAKNSIYVHNLIIVNCFKFVT